MDLSLREKQADAYKESVVALADAYKRHSIIPDINFRSRFLELLAKSVYNPQGDSETAIKSDLGTLINNLQTNQFDVIRARIKMEERKGRTSDLEYYDLLFLLHDGTTKIYKTIYNDGAFQYIVSASAVRNSTLDSFLRFNDSISETTRKSFFFVTINGYGELRVGSEFIADRFFNFYRTMDEKFKNEFIIFLIVELVICALTSVVLIPYVFDVHRTNNKVLSLFGKIPKFEIKILAEKCEVYMKLFLEGRGEKKEEFLQLDNSNAAPINEEKPEEHRDSDHGESSKSSSSGRSSKSSSSRSSVVKKIGDEHDKAEKKKKKEKKKAKEKAKLEKKDKVFEKNNSEEKQKLKDEPKTLDNVQKTIPVQNSMFTDLFGKKDTSMKQMHQTDKNSSKNLNEESNEESDRIGTEKLMNSRDNNRKLIITQFTFFSVVAMVYFIIIFVIELQFLENMGTNIDHLKLITKRPSIIKYLRDFTFEEIVNEKLADYYTYTYKGQNMKEVFVNQLYQNERDVFQSFKNSYPSQFDEYKKLFEQFNYNDLCANYFAPFEQAKKDSFQLSLIKVAQKFQTEFWKKED